MIELKQYASMLWRWWWLVVAATVLAAGISFWTSLQLPRVYSATATLLVGLLIQTPNPQPQDFTTSERLAQTYVQLVRRQPLLQAAVENLGLQGEWQAVASRVSARVIPGTQLIQVSVTGSDPRVAKLVADEVARQLVLMSPAAVDREEQQRRDFANQQAFALQNRIREAEEELQRLDNRLAWETSARAIQDIQNQIAAEQQKIAGWRTTYTSLVESTRGGRTNNLTIVEPAVASSRPISPNIPRNVGIAAGIGFLLAVAGVLLIEYLDDTIRTRDDAERILKLPLLGAVNRIDAIQGSGGPLVALRGADTPAGDAYRIVRAGLRSADLPRTGAALLITSAVPDEGKTTTACNLAIVLAQGGRRVILCDADLRQPSMHRLFDVSGETGLANLLLDEALDPDAVLLGTPVAGLKLLPSGSIDANPADLLGSEMMARRLGQLTALADVVVIDSPAVLAAADTLLLGAMCSGTVLVVRAGRTRRNLVQEARAALDRAGLRIYGVVLNQAGGRPPKYRRYYSREGAGPSNWWRAIAGRRLGVGANGAMPGAAAHDAR